MFVVFEVEFVVQKVQYLSQKNSNSFVEIKFEILSVKTHFKAQYILNLISTKLSNIFTWIFL